MKLQTIVHSILNEWTVPKIKSNTVDELISNYFPKYFKEPNSMLIIYDGAKYTFLSTGKYNIKEIIEKLKSKISGKGGGGKEKGTFISERKTDIKEIIEFMEVLR